MSNLEAGNGTHRQAPEAGRLASLDGLRAVSILLVFAGHLSGTKGFPEFPYSELLAFQGVVVFFVISGYLITTLLFSEHAKHGRVSLKLFYMRRSIRIFPASYAYLAVLFGLWSAGAIVLNARDFWYSITYMVNYLPTRSWEVGHLWSLSIEEQFYLLWPFVFVKLGPGRVSWAAIAAIAAAPAARLVERIYMRGSAWEGVVMFPMVADCLATGCLLACLSGWLQTQPWYRALCRPGPSILLLAAVIGINLGSGYGMVAVFGRSISNIMTAILVHRSVLNPSDFAGKLLNSRFVASIGVLSYSLYLWQQLFINRSGTAWVHAFPQNAVLAVCAALASYLILEKPLLNLRHRLRA